jgi:23S rRNA pseudouridine1911/1915/1917 synthase
MPSDDYLGFPVPLLGWAPVRLPVLFDDGQRIALAKPPGVLAQQDSWFPRLPVLVEAIRHQAAAGKPEFKRLRIGQAGLWAVTDLDPELAGPVLFARDREQAEVLRNALGSGEFLFSYELVTSAAPPSEALSCDLPLARHSRQPCMLVSHTSGKRSETAFETVEVRGGYAVIRASTHFPRRHQVLLHAYESGLPVLGDTVYARTPPLLLSRLKRNYRPHPDREERPLLDGPACYLRELQIGDSCRIQMAPPSRWRGLLKQLEKHSVG